MTPEEFTKKVLEERHQLMTQLLQLCAQEVHKEVAGGGGNPLNVLLTMRMQIEQLILDMRTLTTALLTLGVIDPEKYAATLNRITAERVAKLKEGQSKIVIVKG